MVSLQDSYRQAFGLGVKACLSISFYPDDSVPTLVPPVRQVSKRAGEHLRSLGRRVSGWSFPRIRFNAWRWKSSWTALWVNLLTAD